MATKESSREALPQGEEQGQRNLQFLCLLYAWQGSEESIYVVSFRLKVRHSPYFT